MRRFGMVLLLLLLAACGETAAPTDTPAPSAVAQAAGSPTAMPTATARPTNTPAPNPTATKTPAPSPSPVPTRTVAPEVTASPAELDTPSLTDGNAPPTAAPQPPPNPASDPDQPVRLVVGGASIDQAPVSVGLDARSIPIVPRHEAGWYNLSAHPGQGENVVFWGHVLRWKDSPSIPAPFANLQQAGVGSPVTVYTADGRKFNYTITQQVWVTPDQVQYILPVGSERVTLVSCIGDKVVTENGIEMSHRLITIAEPAR